MQELEKRINHGFSGIDIESKYKHAARTNILKWLHEKAFEAYVPQLLYMIEQGFRDELLDSFYQMRPFGTGGRRGPVGIGPNRINPWTVMCSAQGHAQFLLKKWGDEAKIRGIVVGYDVRKYIDETYFDVSLPNPVRGLDCRTLAECVSSVYTANKITVYLFPDYSPTPEVSFMVRHLGAVAGEMISASHNPPEHNGQKVQDESGGQLIPPFDQELVDIVTNEVQAIHTLSLDDASTLGRLKYVSEEQRAAYISYISSFVYGSQRSAKVYFSPFHGTSQFSVLPALRNNGFDVIQDEATLKIDPTFSGVPFGIPNPEIEQSYELLIQKAEQQEADIILVTDPDGDRIGCMSKEATGRRFYNGNELAVIVLSYVVDSLQVQGKLLPSHTVCTTLVTTGLLGIIARQSGIRIIDDLLVGIKYIADCINQLAETEDGEYLFGAEESHGMTMGEMREKDSAIPALILSELASVCKDEGKTLGDYLDEVYQTYGYVQNYLTEIRLPGAEGMSKIQRIMDTLRKGTPTHFGDFTVQEVNDMRTGTPFRSETDRVARNVLVYFLGAKSEDIEHIKVTVRPSGTEPKVKFYIEVAVSSALSLDEQKEMASHTVEQVERAVLLDVYSIIGIDFPERGFLLFWQLPLQSKLKYFEIEDELAAFRDIPDSIERKEKVVSLLSFLGANPIQKVNDAFEANFGESIETYLSI